jgi:hypothetical protein
MWPPPVFWGGLRPRAMGVYAFVQLNAVSCPTPGICFVAGSYETSAGPLGLILSRIGNSWMPAASLTSTYDLTGISCLLRQHCFAVGQQSYSDPILVTGP